MNTILVSYDLIAPGQSYPKLRDHLKSYPGYAKPLESFWLIRTTLPAAQVRDAALKYVDENDKIFTIDVTGRECAWNNLLDGAGEWIHSTWKES